MSYITSSHITKYVDKIKLWAIKMKKDGIEFRVGDSAFYFKLGNILEEKNLSKNKLCQETGTDYKVITRYLTGNLLRIDTIVLARLCEFLDCEMTDIIDFKRNVYKKEND